MKNLKRCLLCWTCLGVGSIVALAPNESSGQAEGLTLEQAVRAALAQDPGLAAARQRVEATAGRAVQARLWPNPQLEFLADDMPAASDGASDTKYWGGVSQTVPFPGKKALDDRIGRKEVGAAEAESRAREIELVRDVTAAYYRALAVEQKAAASGQLLELSRSVADAARKRVAAGEAADQERLRAEIEQDRAEVALSTEQRELTIARKELARLLGRGREPLGALAGALRETIPSPDFDQLRARMLEQHPHLKAALAGRERAELEWQRARREPLPDVTVGVAGGRDTRENETLVAFRLSVPLPLFDRAQGRKREARALAEIAGNDRTATERKLLEEFDVAEARVKTSSEQVAAYRQRILPRAEEALKLVRGGFEAGKFGFLDLADTQRTLAEARLGYLDRLLELNLAVVDLEALAGTQSIRE